MPPLFRGKRLLGFLLDNYSLGIAVSLDKCACAMPRSAALLVTTNASFKNRRRTILSTYRNLFALRNLFVHLWRADQDNFVRASACLHHPGKPVKRRARQGL
jgi:hypothetical protein